MTISTTFRSNVLLEFYPIHENRLPANLRLMEDPESEVRTNKFKNGDWEKFLFDGNLTVVIYNVEKPIDLITIADEDHDHFKIKIKIDYSQKVNEISLNTNFNKINLTPYTYINFLCIRRNNYRTNETFGWVYDKTFLRKNDSTNESGYSSLKYLVNGKIFCRQFKCILGNNNSITLDVSSDDKEKYCRDKHLERNIVDEFDISDPTCVILVSFLYLYGTVFVLSRNIFIDFKY
uniref:Uncharacterized protein n=1 Tax=Strongyloides papillosus TaxID=174720 RepID=A0A0N5BYY2_STREA